MELHIWTGPDFPVETKCSLFETHKALKNSEERVDTTQVTCCSTEWILKGCEVFVHLLDGEVVLIKLGYNHTISKEIRAAHNLTRMLLANMFGYAVNEEM